MVIRIDPSSTQQSRLEVRVLPVTEGSEAASRLASGVRARGAELPVGQRARLALQSLGDEAIVPAAGMNVPEMGR